MTSSRWGHSADGSLEGYNEIPYVKGIFIHNGGRLAKRPTSNKLVCLPNLFAVFDDNRNSIISGAEDWNENQWPQDRICNPKVKTHIIPHWLTKSRTSRRSSDELTSLKIGQQHNSSSPLFSPLGPSITKLTLPRKVRKFTERLNQEA